jgi:DNA-binding NarL/FixJ family response regulator
MQERFAPLVGADGYRGLLEQAHTRAVAAHPILERWSVRTSGTPFFGGPEVPVDGANGADVWDGMVALTREFLALSETVAHEDHAASEWRIFVIDRDLATCQAMGRALEDATDFHVVGHALRAEDVGALVDANDVDFVVVSGHLSSDEVLSLCRWARKEHTGERPHIVVTGLPQDHALILRFLEAGAAAFTMGAFSVEGLRLSIRLLARGEAVFPLRLQHLMSLRLSELAELVRDRGLDPDSIDSLTPREQDVLGLMDDDLTNREIAQRLYISEGTVKSHVHHILRKLQVRDRKEAVRVLHLHLAGES